MRLSAYRGRRRRGWPPWTTLRRIRRGHSSPPRELGRRRWEAPQKIGVQGDHSLRPRPLPCCPPPNFGAPRRFLRASDPATRKGGRRRGCAAPVDPYLARKVTGQAGLRQRVREDDAIALRLQGVNGAAPGPGGLALLVVGWPELAVGRAIVEHMIGNDEHG